MANRGDCIPFKKRYRRSRMDGKSVQAIRAKYLAEIEAKQKEIADLREKIKRLELVDKESDSFFKDSPTKYRSTGLTEAVIDAVKSLHQIGAADESGVSATQVCNYLKAHGIQDAANFTVAVHVTLDRLSDPRDKRILVSRETGKKRYKPKEI
jgi:hypothetical protein